jgi:hypothetical protein
MWNPRARADRSCLDLEGGRSCWIIVAKGLEMTKTKTAADEANSSRRFAPDRQ